MNYYFDKTRNIIIAIIIYSYDYCSFNIFKKQNIFNEKNKSSLIGKWAIIGKNSIFIKELFNINLALIQLLKF